MNTAVINIKTEDNVKIQAQKIASELGFSLSSLVNAYLRQLIRTKTVYFSSEKEEPTPYLLRTLRESEKEIEKGETSPLFGNSKEAIDWLRNKKKKYAGKV